MTEFINNNPASGLKAGFGCAPVIFEQSYFEITGEDGNITYLDGFNGRVHIFEGAEGQIKDDLMTRVMLIEDGERAAIVALEIAQAPADQIAYTKDIVSEICDCKPENIWVHVTHQFGFMHRMGNAEKAEIYDEKMKESVTRAAENAVKDLQYAAYGIGTGKCHVSSNKNIINPEAPGEGPYFGPGSALETDPCMTVIRFCSRSGGKDIGFFLSYGTKPSALCTTGKDAGNREVNTEVTGHACKMVEEHFKAPCLFCMPAAGDQYPRETAQYYGFDTDGIWKKIDIGFERGIEIVDRLGKEMGEDAIAIAEKTVCDKTSSEVALYETAFSYRNKAGDAMISIPVSVLILGETALVGFRQEMDCITGRQIRDISPYRTTLMVSFLNGDGKYLGHLEAYKFNNGCGTWETARSAFDIGAAEEFVRVAGAFLCDIKNGLGRSEKWEIKTQSLQKHDHSLFGMTEFGGMSWYVLDRKDGKSFLISEKAVAQREFDTGSSAATWENSTLRTWLNTTFIERFSDKEKKHIITSINHNHSNPRYATSGGSDTEDKVFLLSLEEAELYLGGFSDILKCKFEKDDNPVWWFLRSPGETEDIPACVSASGFIDYHGNADPKECCHGGIRPCLWIAMQ